jgi:hypothetical protein
MAEFHHAGGGIFDVIIRNVAKKVINVVPKPISQSRSFGALATATGNPELITTWQMLLLMLFMLLKEKGMTS